MKVILVLSIFTLFVCASFTHPSFYLAPSMDSLIQDTTKKDSVSNQIIDSALSKKEEKDDFINLETMAIYPDGGMDGFYKYIQKNLVYPKEAKKKKIEGRVFVQFIVGQEGKITDVQTVKGIGGGCDAEAERLLRESKDWIPATQRGKPVKVRMNIPIVFRR